ncbi:hypothetical protein FS749_009607 [Ceratobasidium sp. UAMH 11750]|nr:hypothetical protein FS749_009607 [Ceratobasidium sp. UAMH 11750]
MTAKNLRTIHQFRPGNVFFRGKSFESHSDHSHHHSWRSLVRPPIVRQWMHLGKIHREHTERVPSRLEPFFDLVFVAIAHQLSNSVTENASAVGLANFILIFYPTWSLRSENRRRPPKNRRALAHGASGRIANLNRGRLGREEAATHAIARGILAEVEPSTTPETHSSHYERDPALVTATAFFLVGKFSRVVLLIWYTIALPLFRSSFLLQITYQMLNLFIYLPLLFVRSPPAIITLAVVGLATDYILRYFVGVPIVTINKVLKKYQKYGRREDQEKASEGVDPTLGVCAYEQSREKISSYIPATNIGHFIERTAAFVDIVLGELVLSVVYHATSAQVGFKSIYGSAISSLIIAFNFCWLYFDAERSHTFVHTMRRHWFPSITFMNLISPSVLPSSQPPPPLLE